MRHHGRCAIAERSEAARAFRRTLRTCGHTSSVPDVEWRDARDDLKRWSEPEVLHRTPVLHRTTKVWPDAYSLEPGGFMVVAQRLTEAREMAGYSQDQVAVALDVSRPMISYWESGTRTPRDRQLIGLARLYGVNVPALPGDSPLQDAHTSARMMFRGADAVLPPEAGRGLRDLERFLDIYARLADQTGFAIHGMQQSPFTTSGGFESADDARRKAEEVRAYLRLGLGSRSTRWRSSPPRDHPPSIRRRLRTVKQQSLRQRV
jgi:transcriptional regulator with XRE-family HTH domain